MQVNINNESSQGSASYQSLLPFTAVTGFNANIKTNDHSMTSAVDLPGSVSQYGEQLLTDHVSTKHISGQRHLGLNGERIGGGLLQV